MGRNVMIDFDISGDAQDPRSPDELIQQLQNALQSASSSLRSGPSGFLLDGAKLDVIPVSSNSVAPVRVDVPSVPVFQSPPEMLPPVRETVDEVLARVSMLSVQLDDERLAKEKVEAHVCELVARIESIEATVVDKMKEVDLARSELAKSTSDLFYTKEQLESTSKSLAQAKEMWMKESTRATKLREQLDISEKRVADSDRLILKIQSDFKKFETENINLKHLLNRSNELVSSRVIVPEPVEHSFAQSDSYFVRNGPSTAVLTNAHLLHVPTRELSGKPHNHPLVEKSSKFNQLCVVNDGVLFEDEIIQIGIKAKFSGLGEGVLGVYYGNKTSGTLQNLKSVWENQCAEFLHLTPSPLPTQIGPKSQLCQRVSVQLSGAFVQSPQFAVSFLLPDNTPRTIRLSLPVSVNKFMQVKSLEADDFFANWRQEAFLLNEAAIVVSVVMNLAQIARAATLGGALLLHHQLDTTSDNLVLVGQFPSDSPDGIRCVTIPEALVLVRVEVGSGQSRIAVRSNDPAVAEAVLRCISQQISI